MELAFLIIVFVFTSCLACYTAYRFGYRNGGMKVLNEWKQFNIEYFGEEDV